MRMRVVEAERFAEAVAAIRARFPTLHIDVEAEPRDVDALATIPAQGGLEFEVGMNLQNLDELHLTASHLWVEWFPCGEPAVFQRFLEAAIGLISGQYRILESYVLGKAVKAELQRPIQEDWETVATWSNLGTLLPLPRSIRVVQNSGSNPQQSAGSGCVQL
jgi:hypothetical protein